MTTAISIGPATAILENIVYALPAKLCFITSTLEVETSVDGLIWTALTGSDTTGAIAPGVFVRCSSDATVVLRDAVGIYSSGGGSGSNPFDQDLNTTNSVQFAGLGIGTPGVSGQLQLGDGVGIAWLGGLSILQLNPFTNTLEITDAASDVHLFGGVPFYLGTITDSDNYNRLSINSDGLRIQGKTSGVIDDLGLIIQTSGQGEVSVVAPATTFYGSVSASGYLVGANPGIDTTITTGSLVGKTITIEKGIITGFA